MKFGILSLILTPINVILLNAILLASRACFVIKGRSGQSLVEYALVLSLISMLSIVCMSVYTAQVRVLYGSILLALEAVRVAI